MPSGTIRQITEKGGFRGLFKTHRGLVYQSNWSPRYNKSDKVPFPWQGAMDHDRKYGTYYSFFSDKDFNEEVMKRLYDLRNESTFIFDLAEYGWQKCVFNNEVINSVLLWRCNNGNNVSAK